MTAAGPGRHALAGSRAVMLGDPASLFPRALAAAWSAAGVETILVTHAAEPAGGFRAVPGATVRSSYRSFPLRRMLGAIAGRSTRVIAPATATGAGPSQGPEAGASRTNAWWHNAVLGLATARLASGLHPRFVFGHEIYLYGLSTALTRNTTRVLFPWGYDVREYAHSSRQAFRLVRLALRRAHLVVPSSEEAAEYLVRTFGLRQAQVQAVSWGVDRTSFPVLDQAERAAVRARYGIPADATVVLNSRRAHVDWGAEDGMAAFLRVASGHPQAWYLALGNSGDGGAALAARLRREAQAAGVGDRVVLVEREIPLTEVAALMGASDVYLSLPRFMDMRSSSVLQAAAAGGAGIVADQPEFRRIAERGFAVRLVRPAVESIAAALDHLLGDPAARLAMREANAAYLAHHENGPDNMRRMLDLILAACLRREGR